MVTVLNNKIVLDETDEVLPEKISEKFTKIKILNKSTSQNNLLMVTKADTSSPGPHMTFDRDSASPAKGDQIGKIQWKGRNSDGDQIRKQDCMGGRQLPEEILIFQIKVVR